MIGVPPLEAGALKAAWTNWLPTVRPVRFGAVGTASGVAEARELVGPVPAAFTAATRNRYVVPLVSPPTTAVGAADTPSTAVVHGPPALVACWTT